jgi:aminopeptidase N
LVTGLGQDLVSAVEIHVDPARRNQLRTSIASQVYETLSASVAGSDIQLQLAKVFAAIANSPEQIDQVKAIVSGSLNGLTIDRDLRWYFSISLAERGAITQAELDATLAGDNTVNGQLSHAEAIAALPDAAIKADTWKQLTTSELSSSKREHMTSGFMRPRHADLLAPYVDLYFDGLLEMWNSTSYEEASESVQGLYPRYVIAQETLDKTDSWLAGPGASAPEGLRRYVLEGRDALARSLRIQKRDQ